MMTRNEIIVKAMTLAGKSKYTDEEVEFLDSISEILEGVPYTLDNFKKAVDMNLITNEDGIIGEITLSKDNSKDFFILPSTFPTIYDELKKVELGTDTALVYWYPIAP